jgi:hypothetical protein
MEQQVRNNGFSFQLYWDSNTGEVYGVPA